MKRTKKSEDELKTWQEKLSKYQKKYDELRKQSPDRWWHDEHFDIQLRVFEAFIAEAKEEINKLKRKNKKVNLIENCLDLSYNNIVNLNFDF